MRATIKSNYPFLYLYLIFLFLGGILLVLTSKAEIHLTFNSFHSPFFDQFFFYFTYLGDGILALLVAIILLTVKYRYALIVGISNLLAAVITQTLKQIVFVDHFRPKKYFDGIHDLYFVPGVENHLLYSFPSGHATSAFALYFSLALIVKNKSYKRLFFALALVVAYSRVYLSQHFFGDIYVGSFIGVAVTLLVFQVINNKRSPWLNRSIISSSERQ